MTNPDPHIPQPPVTLPDKLRAIGWGRHSYTGTQIRDICEEAARQLKIMAIATDALTTAGHYLQWLGTQPEIIIKNDGGRVSLTATDYLGHKATSEDETIESAIQWIECLRSAARDLQRGNPAKEIDQ